MSRGFLPEKMINYLLLTYGFYYCRGAGMNRRKWIMLTVLILVAAILILWDWKSNRDSIDAFSGATPQALTKQVPEGLAVTVDGKVKQSYYLSSRALRLFASTRIRVGEVSPRGEILGTYIYYGIPVIHLMEGVAPQKAPGDAFDRPLDLVAVFTSASGKTAAFSYGELTMTSDCSPITLAYYREPLMPSKSPETYKRNKYMDNIKGLRLICPREPDTARYLDDVVRITLVSPDIPDDLLPAMQKGKKCASQSMVCIDEGNVLPASEEGVEVISQSGWLRIGHGRGIKGDSRSEVSGYALTSFLKKNFPACTPEDFFLFVGCDGYRALFSGREIFLTYPGKNFMLINRIDGKEPASGKTVAAVGDFFVDRDVWGLSHVARIKL
jgi:hypothetical protein